MSKKFLKTVGVGAMCLAGALGLTACGGNDKEAKIVSIDVLESTIPNEIDSGEFDNQNIVLKVYYEDGSEKLVTIKTSDIPKEYRSSLLLPGTHNIKVNYGGCEDDMTLTITLSSEKVANILKNAYNYAQTHDHKQKYETSYRYMGISSDSETDESSSEYEILYNYNSTTQKAELLASQGRIKAYYSREKSVGPGFFDRFDNEKINAFKDPDWETRVGDEFAICSALFANRYSPTTILSSGKWTAKYDAKMINGALIYTAQFKSSTNKTIVYTFDNEKVIGLNYEEIDIGETKVNTYLDKCSIEYKEIADSETSEDLVDTTPLKIGMQFTTALLKALKQQDFYVTKSVGTYEPGRNGSVSDAIMYNHTAGSDTVFRGEETFNLYDIVPTFDECIEASYNEGRKRLYVITNSLLQITYEIENDKFSKIKVYDINSDLYYEISFEW